MGIGESALAGQSAGEAFNPANMATSGEGARMGMTPNVMGMDQLQAAHPEATLAELDKAQQAQNAMRTAAL
jgi:hypothetical protein